MTAAVRANTAAILGTYSGGISAAASQFVTAALSNQLKDTSVTIGHKLGNLLSAIASARDEASEANWDDDGAHAVRPEAVDAAIQLATRLPLTWPAPEVTAEPKGGIAFEWYRDRAHLVAITMNGQTLRWVAANGPGRTASGIEPFAKSIPDLAYAAIQKVVAV